MQLIDLLIAPNLTWTALDEPSWKQWRVMSLTTKNGVAERTHRSISEHDAPVYYVDELLSTIMNNLNVSSRTTIGSSTLFDRQALR